MLLDIFPAQTKQYDLLAYGENKRADQVMELVDSINDYFGKNSIFIAAEGIKRERLIRCDRRSFRYTTRWDELPQVLCK